MAKTKKKRKLPSELAQLFDDKVQMETLLPYVDHRTLYDSNETLDIFRAIWRRLFPTVIPPWIITDENREKLEDPGPYAIKGLLTGELCTVCGRPLYLTSNHASIICAGGHDEKQRKQVAKKLLDGNGEYTEMGDPEDWATVDDADDFFD